MASSLWVPPQVDRQLAENTRQHNLATLAMFELNYGIAGKWNKEKSPLRKLDPFLRVGRAKEKADGLGVIPGFYHLLRINPSAPIWVMPLHDGNGGFVEPSDAMLDMLRRADMQNEQVMRDEDKRQEREAKSVERAEALAKEQRVDHMMDNWRALDRPKVLFSDDVKWSNKPAGKRGRV
jgi:hypothetical protein